MRPGEDLQGDSEHGNWPSVRSLSRPSKRLGIPFAATKILAPQLQVELRVITTFVVDVAREVASIACRYGGGTAIQLDCVLQRCLRDLQGESAHLLVSDISYELWGQCMLGMEEVDPMS
jgi:hypothetical protein